MQVRSKTFELCVSDRASVQRTLSLETCAPGMPLSGSSPPGPSDAERDAAKDRDCALHISARRDLDGVLFGGVAACGESLDGFGEIFRLLCARDAESPRCCQAARSRVACGSRRRVAPLPDHTEIDHFDQRCPICLSRGQFLRRFLCGAAV
jgi:hypothetical protein